MYLHKCTVYILYKAFWCWSRQKIINIELSTMSTELSTVLNKPVDFEKFTKCNRKILDLWKKIRRITMSYQQYPQNYTQHRETGRIMKLYKK